MITIMTEVRILKVHPIPRYPKSNSMRNVYVLLLDMLLSLRPHGIKCSVVTKQSRLSFRAGKFFSQMAGNEKDTVFRTNKKGKPWDSEIRKNRDT